MKRLLYLTLGVLLNGYINAQEISPNEWYCIQFAQNGLVVEQQGVGQQLKAAAKTGGGKQLWKVEISGNYANIINKENPELRISYGCDGIFIASTTTETGNELSLSPVGTGSYALHRSLYGRGNAVSQKDGVIVRNGDLSKIYTEDETVHIKFTKLETSGIRTLTSSNAKVYPNPVSDIVYVEDIEEAINISLINAAGQVVKLIKPTGGIEKIDVSAFNPGIYFIKVEKSTGTEIFKIIVNK